MDIKIYLKVSEKFNSPKASQRSLHKCRNRAFVGTLMYNLTTYDNWKVWSSIEHRGSTLECLRIRCLDRWRCP